MVVVDPMRPGAPQADVACADLDTGEVFSYGECVASKARVSATLDVAVRAPIGARQLLVGAGYRAGAHGEPYALLGLSGAATPDRPGWLVRLAAGRRSVGLQVGFAGIG